VTAHVRPDATEDGWDDLVADSAPGPDEELLRAWARSLVAIALTKLEALCEETGQTEHYQLFARRYLADPDHPPSWHEVGHAFGLEEKIARGRADTAVRHFRALLRQLIASDLGSEDDVEKELQTVLALL
jgi:hypothetical protein